MKGIVSIKAEDAAWYAAVGGAGACVLSVLLIWPLMRRSLRQYDQAAAEAEKDAEGQGKSAESYRTQGVQEDRCGWAGAGWLQPRAGLRCCCCPGCDTGMQGWLCRHGV